MSDLDKILYSAVGLFRVRILSFYGKKNISTAELGQIWKMFLCSNKNL